MNRIVLSLLFASIFVSVNIVQSQPSAHLKPVVNVVRIKNISAQLEIADTEELITQGLSDRDYLAPDAGMLFVFPDTTQRSFWMFHCLIDWDIAYINPDGAIQDIQTMTVEPANTPRSRLKLYRSTTNDIKYAIEMNGNWFAQHSISIGDTASVQHIVSHVKNGLLWIK